MVTVLGVCVVYGLNTGMAGGVKVVYEFYVGVNVYLRHASMCLFYEVATVRQGEYKGDAFTVCLLPLLQLRMQRDV